jgi:hypothetical protein
VSWEDEIRRVLDGSIDTANPHKDLTQRLSLEEIGNYHPTPSSSGRQTRLPPKMDHNDADAVGTEFEYRAAKTYAGNGIDYRERDVELGIQSDVAGWPVQVKSCRLKQSDGSDGKFIMRKNEDNLPDKSLSIFYVYRVLGYQKSEDELSQFAEYDEDSHGVLEVDYKDSRFDVEKVGEAAVPNALLKEEIGLDWWKNGKYGIKWPKIFGNKAGQSRLDSVLRDRFSDKEYIDLADF